MAEEYIFTFGSGQPLAGYCVRVPGSYGEARAKMIEKYGLEWAFQYPADQWDEWRKDSQRAWLMEREIKF